MSDETLLSASRRACRFFYIDMAHGGLITRETEAAMLTLDNQWRLEDLKQKEPTPNAKT